MRFLDRLHGRSRKSNDATLAVFSVIISAVVCGSGSPAHGLIITPSFGSSITSDPNSAAIIAAIDSAINEYQIRFSDPIAVSILFNEMTGGLGQSTTGIYNIDYMTYITALHAHATTADDATALGLLPITANNPVNGNSTINIASANGRALGLDTPPAIGATFDGVIGVNTHITDTGSPGTTGQFSLRATVQHEINEVLGLGSSLPDLPFGTISPEDLFRYTTGGARSFNTTATTKAYFSINGTTLLAQFDNQNDGGDFGDWQSNPLPPGVQPQVQDAFATAGAQPVLGVELRALDVIGYTLVTPLVPEPGSMTLLGAGTLVLSGYGWSRRRQRAPRETDGSTGVGS
jgi:hypothetical protein